MNKRNVLCIFVAIIILTTITAEDISKSVQDSDQSFMYIAWNPIAITSIFKIGYFTSVLPVFSNMEAGIAFAVGYYDNSNMYEFRFSLGNANYYNIIMQFQISYLFFIGEYLDFLNKGLYFGFSSSFLSVNNINSEDITSHIYPAINIGWSFYSKRFFIDLRISNMFAVYSFSSNANSIPGFEFAFSPLSGISSYLPIVLLQFGHQL